MASYRFNDFNRISFYINATDTVPEVTKSILFSLIPKNEILGMMNADFTGIERSPMNELMNSEDLINEVSGATNEMTQLELDNLNNQLVEIISNLGMMQVDDDEIELTDKYESYITLPESKLIVLRIDKSYSKIRLFNSNNLDGIDLILENTINESSNNSVDKYVIISQSGSISTFNPSVNLHDNSDYPHSNLGAKILISEDYYDLIIQPEVMITDKVISIKADTILGDDIIRYDLFDNLFNLSVDENYNLLITI